MRASLREIEQNRIQHPPTLLVTGATGFLGSHLAVELLDQGYSLFLLCRPQDHQSALERMTRLFNWFGKDLAVQNNCTVLEGHLGQPEFGLNKQDYTRLIESADEILHCAANTSFAERRRKEVESANVESVRNVLMFAAQSRCYFFHHLSTAYVAGTRQGLCPETIENTQRWHNVYEETKYLAEKMAVKICSQAGIRLNIFRPTIVYGNSRTGRSFRFNALYYPIKLIHYLSELYRRDIRENRGCHAAKMGVSLDEDGYLDLPVRIKNSKNGRLNVISIDYFVQTVLGLMQGSMGGDIFHISNPKPVFIDQIIKYIGSFLNVKGITAVSEEEFTEPPNNAVEALVEKHLDTYLPYMQDARVFKQDKADALLGKQKPECPVFDYTMFERCVSYAVKAAWGKSQKDY